MRGSVEVSGEFGDLVGEVVGLANGRGKRDHGAMIACGFSTLSDRAGRAPGRVRIGAGPTKSYLRNDSITDTSKRQSADPAHGNIRSIAQLVEERPAVFP